MDFESMIQSIEAMGLNLYDFALYTPEAGIRAHVFQPCNHCNDSYSVAKAYVVTAIGLLWDQGKIQVTDRIYPIMQEYFHEAFDPNWRLATVEHAMLHRLGFAKERLDIDTDDVTAYGTEDYLHRVLTGDLPDAPGSKHLYTDAAYYLLSRIVHKLSGEPLDVFLNERIIRPLRYREIAWSRCPYNEPIGATGLYVSAGDMVKLGALYLNGGVWEGKRLLSEAWVGRVIENEYEFHRMGPNGLIGKGGLYGQAVVFSREKGFAAAWHGHNAGGAAQKLVEFIDGI